MNKYKDSLRRQWQRSATGLAVELASEVVLERTRGEGRYKTAQVTGEDEVSANRRFATSRFASLGKISVDSIDPETGLLRFDRFHEAGAVQYVTTERDGSIASVGKLIWADGLPMEELRTPFDRIAQTNPELVEKLRSLPDGSVGELGSLAKASGISQVAVLSTLSEIYRVAEDRGVQYVVAGLEPAAWPRYRALFGSGIELMSEEPLQYPGINGDQVGICMDITNAYDLYKRDFFRDNWALRCQRVLVSELYANRVASFRPHLGRSVLRNLA